MTRINVVPVDELCDKHLLAEYRELPRIYGAAKRWYVNQGTLKDIPPTYRMGKGHVKFFFIRLTFCYNRHRQLYHQCLFRKFNVQYGPRLEAVEWAPAWMMNDYDPTPEAFAINRERIAERLRAMRSRDRTSQRN